MMSWLWLACGAALLPFTGLQTTIPLAGWLAPIFLLRFTRTVLSDLALDQASLRALLYLLWDADSEVCLVIADTEETTQEHR